LKLPRGKLVRGHEPASQARGDLQAAFRSGGRSVIFSTSLSAGNPSSSIGCLPRLIQKVVRPKEAAPATSQELEETKPNACAAVSSLFGASSYTRGLGL